MKKFKSNFYNWYATAALKVEGNNVNNDFWTSPNSRTKKHHLMQ